MSEKINELLEKCTEDVLGVQVVDYKLFARLIIEKCGELADENIDNEDAVWYPSVEIKSYFGV